MLKKLTSFDHVVISIKKHLSSRAARLALATVLVTGATAATPAIQNKVFQAFADTIKNEETAVKSNGKSKSIDKSKISFIKRGGYQYMIPLLFLGFLSSMLWVKKLDDFADKSTDVDEVNRVFNNIFSKKPDEAKKELIKEFEKLKFAVEHKNILRKIVSKILNILPIKKSESKKIALEATLNAFENIDTYKEEVAEMMITEYNIEKRALGSGINLVDKISSIATRIGLIGTIQGLITSIGSFSVQNFNAFVSGMELAGISTFAGLIVSLISIIIASHLDYKLEEIDFEVDIANQKLRSYLRIHEDDIDEN